MYQTQDSIKFLVSLCSYSQNFYCFPAIFDHGSFLHKIVEIVQEVLEGCRLYILGKTSSSCATWVNCVNCSNKFRHFSSVSSSERASFVLIYQFGNNLFHDQIGIGNKTARVHLVRVTPKIFGVGFKILRRTGVRSTRCRRTELNDWRTFTNLLDMWWLWRINKNKFTFECLYLCRTPLTVQLGSLRSYYGDAGDNVD